jgi:ACS family tartrate transporter-like MFS transporter
MQWYPAAMRARAITRFYIAFPLSSVVMGALAGALMSLQGRLSLTGWQWLFLVEALPAVALGVAFFLLLPDGPADAPWLSQPERQSILAAVAHDAPSLSDRPDSISSALRDPRTWLIGIFFLFVQAGNYGYTFSAPAIVQHLTSWSIAATGYFFVALGLAGAAAMLLSGRLSDASGERHMHVLPWCLVMLAGFLGCGLSQSPLVALPALALVFLAYCAMQGPLWAIPAAFLTGRSAAAGIAAINMIGILGGFVGPYWMGFARDLTGDYQRGLLMMALPMLAAAAIMLHLHLQERRATRCATTSKAVASIP